MVSNSKVSANKCQNVLSLCTPNIIINYLIKICVLQFIFWMFFSVSGLSVFEPTCAAVKGTVTTRDIRRRMILTNIVPIS